MLEVKAATSLFVRTSRAATQRRVCRLYLRTADPRVISAAQAGTYTVTVRGFGNATVGQPIVVTVDGVSRFVNLSARAWVGPGGAAAGANKGYLQVSSFRGKAQDLLRGIGPALGVVWSGLLRDASLSVYSPQGTPLHSNDGWDRAPTAPASSRPRRTLPRSGRSLSLQAADAALVLEIRSPALTPPRSPASSIPSPSVPKSAWG